MMTSDAPPIAPHPASAVMDSNGEPYSVIYAGCELRVLETEDGWQIEIDPAPRSGDRTMTFGKLSEALDEAMQIVDQAAAC